MLAVHTKSPLLSSGDRQLELSIVPGLHWATANLKLLSNYSYYGQLKLSTVPGLPWVMPI